MSNIIFYAHGGSGNHGCEAIVRASQKILGNIPITLLTSSPDQDIKYGVDRICRLVTEREETVNRFSPDFFHSYAALKLKKDFIPLEKMHYKKAFSAISKGDIAFSIGGDNYCYADVYKYRMFHDLAKARGAKTVLWGCSVEPDVLKDPVTAADLSRYDLITARETISYGALKAVNPHTFLVSDPAFLLDSVNLPLPDGFVEGNTVGINISPMIMKNESVPGLAMENYRTLISYILKETDMSVALIPHVVWQGNDDRIPLKTLYDEFHHSGRVVLIGDHTCEALKGFIARCRFFVGARTHATIAAYSSCVPTLVVGYSVKARGIARDLLGTEVNHVLPVQTLSSPHDLTKAFQWLEKNRPTEISKLDKALPLYLKKSEKARDYIHSLRG